MAMTRPQLLASAKTARASAHHELQFARNFGGYSPSIAANARQNFALYLQLARRQIRAARHAAQVEA